MPSLELSILINFEMLLIKIIPNIYVYDRKKCCSLLHKITFDRYYINDKEILSRSDELKIASLIEIIE